MISWTCLYAFHVQYSVPGAVNDLTVITAERSAVLLASPPDERSGIVIYYEVLYGIVGSANLTLNISTDDEYLNGTIGSLLPFSNYEFLVRSCTITECGPISNVVMEMTLEDGELHLAYQMTCMQIKVVWRWQKSVATFIIFLCHNCFSETWILESICFMAHVLAHDGNYIILLS